MKRNLFSIVLLTCLAAFSARADLIMQELFNYSDGSVTTNSSGVWIRHSGTATAPGDAIVKGRREEIGTSTAYLGVTVTRQDDVHRNLSVTNNSPYTNAQQVLYASFIVNFTNLPTAAGAYFAHFYVNTTTFQGRLWALTNGSVLPNTFRLAASAGSAATPSRTYPVDLALNTDYQVVLGYDPVNLNAMTLWVNPVSSTDFSVTTSDSLVPGANIVTGFGLRQASGFGGFLTLSNLVVSTTYDEAATNVLATNAVPPKIVLQPVGVTNFPSSAISLAAIANGQGLGSLVYQWQISTNASNSNPVSLTNPNGNSNIFPISSTSTNDSGYYSLVVTTPYGLSVTSAVAKVSIIDGAFPPVFTVQPASQSIFSGQSATLTTTVLSPPSGGQLTFTWFSNNVAVSAGQADNGNTSTYSFVNAATNVSANYKVAVTNVYGGIVSTNAALTVSAIPSVSVYYLRTLVDPVTFLPTNVPATIPYKITGVITTATNSTTGDTSSYFLQDGTAGINIFATFGSTFRPALGDVVTFVGVMSSFSTTGLELFADTVNRSYTSYSIISNNFPLPTPRTIPFNVTNSLGFTYVATNLAGSLVTLTNVYFGTNAGTVLATNANAAITVTNAGGQSIALQFFSLNQDTAGKTLPAFAPTVTGILYGFHPNYSVNVNRFSDIVTNVPVVLTPIPLTIQTVGTNVLLSWTNSTFSLQSSTNVAGPFTTIPASTGQTNYTDGISNRIIFYRLIH
jgi:hypothetical protein